MEAVITGSVHNARQQMSRNRVGVEQRLQEESQELSDGSATKSTCNFGMTITLTIFVILSSCLIFTFHSSFGPFTLFVATCLWFVIGISVLFWICKGGRQQPDRNNLRVSTISLRHNVPLQHYSTISLSLAFDNNDKTALPQKFVNDKPPSYQEAVVLNPDDLPSYTWVQTTGGGVQADNSQKDKQVVSEFPQQLAPV